MAQNSNQNNTQTFTDSSKVELEEVFISSSKWNEKSRNNTKEVTKISKLDVALYNPQTAADLLTVSEQVYVQKSQQGGGSPMIRGFSTNRLLYSMDGIRLNNAIYRGGNIHNVISLDPNAIDNTEIIFGPGSVTYGSDAIGAVMSFSSLNHKNGLSDSTDIHGKSNFRFSSANEEFSGHYDFNIAKGKWSFISSVSKTKYTDLKMGNYGPSDYLQKYVVKRIGTTDSIETNGNQKLQNPSGYEQIHTLHKVRYKASKHLDVDYNVHFSQSNEYGRYDRLYPLNQLPNYAVWNYGPQKWIMNHLSITNTKKRKLFSAFKLNLAHQFQEESRISRKINSDDIKTQVENVNAYSLNLDFKKDRKKHVIYYGAELVYNRVNSWGNTVNVLNDESFTSAARYPKSDWAIFALYLKYNQKIGTNTVFTSGIRTNSYYLKSNFNSQNNFYNLPFNEVTINKQSVNGIVGISWQTKHWEIKSNVSSGFRAPNVDDVGKTFDFQDHQIVVPNGNLKSEVAYTADLSISKKLSKWGTLGLGTFYTLLDDAMVRREFKLNGEDSILYEGSMSKVFAIQNASYAFVYGISGKLEIKLSKAVQVKSSVNYQKGTEVIDDVSSPSRHAAPLFMTNSVTLKIKKVVLKAYHQYNSGYANKQLSLDQRDKTSIYALDENGLPFSPYWHTFNLKGILMLSNHWVLSGGIENLADIRYRTYSSGISAPGRNYIVAVKVMF
ncbi:MAG: hemoglobin/transferrin/lactoferrin receptor protein [Glaciecola sp.]|jgi:hemoglobin/transferrin/lactoferrin receptor protein